MGKRQARERRQKWEQAILEGRVVRFDFGQTFKSFLSKLDADKAIEEATNTGRKAERVSK